MQYTPIIHNAHCIHCFQRDPISLDIEEHSSLKYGTFSTSGPSVAHVTCKQCGKKYFTKSGLHKHRILVHDVKSRFQCGQRFTNRAYLEGHMNRQAPYRCQWCGRGTTWHLTKSGNANCDLSEIFVHLCRCSLLVLSSLLCFLVVTINK